MMGRGFLPEDCVPGAPQVAVISYGTWQRVFGGTSDVVGRAITLNDRPFTVIGVMPAGFSYEPAADLWFPLHLRIDARDRGRNYMVITRQPACFSPWRCWPAWFPRAAPCARIP
jgi:hypothetical protein